MYFERAGKTKIEYQNHEQAQMIICHYEIGKYHQQLNTPPR
jgi:hypothetical protein